MTVNTQSALNIFRSFESKLSGYGKLEYKEIADTITLPNNQDGLNAYSLWNLVSYGHKNGVSALNDLIDAIEKGYVNRDHRNSMEQDNKKDREKNVTGNAIIDSVEAFDSLYKGGANKYLFAEFEGENYALTDSIESVVKRLQQRGIHTFLDLLSEEKQQERQDVAERSKYFTPLRQALPDTCKLTSAFSDSGKVEITILSSDFMAIHKALETISGLVLEAMQPNRCIERGMERVGYKAIGKYINQTGL